MTNHAHSQDAINSELNLCDDSLNVSLEDGNEILIHSYFTMKAGLEPYIQIHNAFFAQPGAL